ncbi:MAG: hypothetical protein ACR2QC_09140 [Gammaproteobacteria bacterium]
MVYEWFLIALPVVFLAGWFAARLDIRHIRKSAGELPRAYLRGLSHLLRGEKNRALDSFLRARTLDPESDELRFAIGELSRVRGEHRRALGVHLELCGPDATTPANRTRAIWELALDYQQMGFFDLAEKHAALLEDEEEYRERAGDMLLNIRQRARDYERALEVLDKMPVAAALLRRKTRAHLLCECALRQGGENPDKKRAFLDTALEADGRCARAGILLGDAAAAAGKFADAAAHYAACERQNTDYLWRATPGIIAAFESRNMTDAGCEKARGWLDAYPSAPLFAAVYRQLAARGRAGEMAQDGVRRGFGATAAAAWAEEQLSRSEDSRRDFWRALEKTLSASGWRCDNCGYKTEDFVWQCHNCLSWESFRYAPQV